MRAQNPDFGGQPVSGPIPVTTNMGLDQLLPRQQGTVVGLRPAGNAQEQSLVLRLMEIGFLPGEPVRIVATGFPGGHPLAVRVGQATFALRRDEAAWVLVASA